MGGLCAWILCLGVLENLKSEKIFVRHAEVSVIEAESESERESDCKCMKNDLCAQV